MAKIKIIDLPKNMKISQAELKRIQGGAYGPYLPMILRAATQQPGPKAPPRSPLEGAMAVSAG